ncbi:hypothetical protein KSW81_002186 [Nannochloris sp. 'desiccata']|nr:hypothetical protein KSW81_002186 [Chlorella desiccata (nom. nud.)]
MASTSKQNGWRAGESNSLHLYELRGSSVHYASFGFAAEWNANRIFLWDTNNAGASILDDDWATNYYHDWATKYYRNANAAAPPPALPVPEVAASVAAEGTDEN